MKKTLLVVALAVAAAVSQSAQAAAPAAVDLSGAPLYDGDVISANQSEGDPDLYIIKMKNHSRWPGDSDINGFKRLFLNPRIFAFYGHLGGFELVRQVTGSVRDSFLTSGLFRNCETADLKVYATEVTGEDDGVLHHVDMTGEQAMAEDVRFFDRVFCINSNEERFYAKSITAYRRLAELPVYKRMNPCVQLPACARPDANPRCQIDPVPGVRYCPIVPAPMPERGPYISAISPSSAVPGSRIKLYGRGFGGYSTGHGGFTTTITISGSDGVAWTYPKESANDYLVFELPKTLNYQVCADDVVRGCARQEIPLGPGKYFVRVVIEGDGLARMTSNTVDLAVSDIACEPLPPCALPGANPQCALTAAGPYGRPWCAPAQSGKCFIGGCSGQLCSDRPDMASTCEYRAEYACYKQSGVRCERRSDGLCRWAQTAELQSCLANPPSL